MAHFYEKIHEDNINYSVEFSKIISMVKVERHYFTSYSEPFLDYLNDNIFRSLKIAGNYNDVFQFFLDVEDSAKDAAELFLFTCELILTLLYQADEKFGLSKTMVFKNFLADVIRVIDYDLRKLNLTKKKIEHNEFGNIIVIIPNDELLEKTLEDISDRNIQDYLIEYSSSRCDGNIQRKEELLILMQKYVEGFTKNKDLSYKEFHKELFSNVDYLYNNLDLRHNKDVKDKSLYLETKDNREYWLDMLYRLSLYVINIPTEVKYAKQIKEVKRKIYGDN